jgi:hypothetical protein
MAVEAKVVVVPKVKGPLEIQWFYQIRDRIKF